MSSPATTTTPPLSMQQQLRKRAVVTVTSVAESTGTSSSSTSQKTSIPIGPIVGGIVAGVAAVLIVGGIWFWCHRKSEREKEDARERALARANRKAAGGARPTLIKNKSTVSDHSTKSSHYAEKDQVGGGGGGGGANAPPVPAIPSHYLVGKNAGAGGAGGGYPQGPPGAAAAYGQERQYDQPQYVEPRTDGAEYYANEPSRSPISPTGSAGSSIPSPKSSSSGGSSSSDRRSRAQQRIDAANAAKEREAVLAAANPSGRYQPARPSPLRAQEKKDEDEQAVPKWGSKPFRSAHSNEQQEVSYQTQQQQQHQQYPQAPAPVSLAPPVDTTRDKAVSGEWGVAYSDVDDGAGAFEHDDYDTRSDGRKSMGPDVGLSAAGGRQATGYAYDPSPRSRTVSGGAAPMPDRRSQQYQPQQQQQQYYGGGAPAYDPYAHTQRGYQNDEDPYAPSQGRQQRGGF